MERQHKNICRDENKWVYCLRVAYTPLSVIRSVPMISKDTAMQSTVVHSSLRASFAALSVASYIRWYFFSLENCRVRGAGGGAQRRAVGIVVVSINIEDGAMRWKKRCERDGHRPESGLDNDWLAASRWNRIIHQRMRFDEVERLVGQRPAIVGAHLYANIGQLTCRIFMTIFIRQQCKTSVRPRHKRDGKTICDTNIIQTHTKHSVPTVLGNSLNWIICKLFNALSAVEMTNDSA